MYFASPKMMRRLHVPPTCTSIAIGLGMLCRVLNTSWFWSVIIFFNFAASEHCSAGVLAVACADAKMLRGRGNVPFQATGVYGGVSSVPSVVFTAIVEILGLILKFC